MVRNKDYSEKNWMKMKRKMNFIMNMSEYQMIEIYFKYLISPSAVTRSGIPLIKNMYFMCYMRTPLLTKSKVQNKFINYQACLTHF